MGNLYSAEQQIRDTGAYSADGVDQRSFDCDRLAVRRIAALVDIAASQEQQARQLRRF
jgi:hypothetical protein